MLGRLISDHGPRIVHAVVDAQGTPFFWNAVERDRTDCANMLLDYAKSKGLPVTFKCEGGDLLSRAIDNESEAHFEFVLDKLAGKYTTVLETIELLRTHLLRFSIQFRRIAHNFFKEDRFTMEYARFDAPKALFGRKGEAPVGMSTDRCPKHWAMDSQGAKDFWIQNSNYGERLSDTAGRHVRVVARFSCIHPWDFHYVCIKRYIYSSV